MHGAKLHGGVRGAVLEHEDHLAAGQTQGSGAGCQAKGQKIPHVERHPVPVILRFVHVAQGCEGQEIHKSREPTNGGSSMRKSQLLQG